ncbi:MAG: penicillin acylase family protein [Saprospiraceae bacterium]|nr:penicillin acylase family protein [Saprospiraceae bacterium]
MKYIWFFLCLFATIGFIYVLDNPINTKEKDIPALGKLLNPFSGIWQNAASVHTQSYDDFHFPQLKGKVTVQFDERNVPHIFAENVSDAFFVQGFINAQDRLWQMDIATRAEAGRLSEIMGEKTLERDLLQRRKGILLSAEKSVEEWKKSPETYQLLESFTAGINAYINQLQPKDYPIEFKLLGYAPEQWSPLKSALFVKSMIETLAGNNEDIEATNTFQKIGKIDFELLFPERNPDDIPVVPSGTPYNFKKITSPTTPQSSIEDIGLVPFPPLPKMPKGLGSNNWAVASSKTLHRKPILCNDPHLNLTLPAIWYEVQIHTPEFNAYGVSFPMIPGIIIGFNENIAWGQTNVGQDVLDWYKIKWTDDKKTTYSIDGQAEAVKEVVEVIQVKGKKEPIRDTVKYTRWGPIVFKDAKHPKYDLAMHWIALEQTNPMEISTFYQLNKAKNFNDFQKALKEFVAPAQNFVFAAKSGDIAIQVNGKLPIKKKEQGRFVQDGSNSDNAWGGWIPAEQRAVTRNPSRGYVASANQYSTDVTYPYYYNGEFEDWRGITLNKKLSKMDSITVEDMMQLQNDNYNLKAATALPYMLSLLDTTKLSNDELSIFHKLKAWDFYCDKEKAEPTFYEIWADTTYQIIWDEFINFKTKEGIAVMLPEDWRTIDLMKKQPNLKYFDIQQTPEKEGIKDVVRLSFKNAFAKYNSISVDKTWAKYKDVFINHLGLIPAFASRKLNVGGHADALNAIKTKANNGPSWRMIVELGDTINAYGVYPGGASGNPSSPFYNNMIDKWEKGEYYKLNFFAKPQPPSEKIISTQTFSK